MARPRHSDKRRHLLGAIVLTTFRTIDREKFPKIDDAVAETSRMLKSKLESNPRWKGMPISPRSVYSLLKEFRELRKRNLIQRYKWRLN